MMNKLAFVFLSLFLTVGCVGAPEPSTGTNQEHLVGVGDNGGCQEGYDPDPLGGCTIHNIGSDPPGPGDQWGTCLDAQCKSGCGQLRTRCLSHCGALASCRSDCQVDFSDCMSSCCN